MPERRDPASPTRRQSPRVGGRRATDPPAEWLSVSAYASRYGVDRSTVYKWLSVPGILTTYRVGTLLRVRNVPPENPDLAA